MSLRRVVGRCIAETAAVAHPLLPPRSGLRILAYHAVGSEALGDRLGIFSISPELFRRQMDLLVAGFSDPVVPLTSSLPIDGSPAISITFDDGYRDNLMVAAPLLAERGLPFTVFVSSGLVRDRHSGFLTPAELHELAALPGATIGAHGATHIPLADCDDDRLRQELTTSKAWLEDETGGEVTTMAYPYGSVDRRVRQAAVQAGYRLAACSYPDINGRGRDRLMLGRTSILAGDGLRVFRQKLRGCWDWYRFLADDPAGY